MQDITFPLHWRIALVAPALAIFLAFWLLPMGVLAQVSAKATLADLMKTYPKSEAAVAGRERLASLK